MVRQKNEAPWRRKDRARTGDRRCACPEAGAVSAVGLVGLPEKLTFKQT